VLKAFYRKTRTSLTFYLVLAVLHNPAGSSLFGASQFSGSASVIPGLGQLTSDVPYVLQKLDENTFGLGPTNTDGGLRQCYEKLPGNGSDGILTRGYTNTALPRMIIMLTDGTPTVRMTDTLPNSTSCPCTRTALVQPTCPTCSVQAATKRGAWRGHTAVQQQHACQQQHA
jgi:hypothetical protein